MKLTADGAWDVLSFETTGREVCPNRGIIGIDPNGDVFDGFDGHLGIEYDSPLTKDERNELADYMIARWQAFKTH